MITIYLLTNLIWCFRGAIEAWGYSAQSFKVKGIKKLLLVPARAVDLLTILVIATFVQNIDIIAAIFLGLSLIFSFSFFHNGFYEVTDDLIRKTYKSFFKSFANLSTNDSSILSYDFGSRVWMLLFSILLLTSAIFINETPF